jgi:tetratricopeptide (TPR) repeat protein
MALLTVGAAHGATGEATLATEALTRAATLAPGSPAPHRALGALLVDLDPARSAEAARRALAAAGGVDAHAQGVLAQALVRIASDLADDVPGAERAQAWKRALDAAQSASEQSPRDASPMLAAIEALEGLGRVGDTLAWHERLLALAELPAGVDRSALLNNQGDAMLRAVTSSEGVGNSKTLGDSERAQLAQALGVVQKAISLRASAPYFETLASIQLALGNVSGAIDAARQAVSLDSAFVPGRLALVRALARGDDAQRREAGALARELLEASDARARALPEATRRELEAVGAAR